MAKEAVISKADAVFILKELQRRGLLKSYVLSETAAAVPFGEYLADFWDWEKSPYIKEKRRKNHGIHRRHVLDMSGAVKKYWIPHFEGKLLGEVTRQDIEGFFTVMECNEALSPLRKNRVILAGLIALRFAHAKEMIDRDITKGLVMFSGKPKERQILTPELAAAVFRVDWQDDRTRLANMLAMVTGLRASEIQGLRVQDLGQDCLYVKHAWNFMDGLKTTKNNEVRMVEVPFPGLIRELVALAGQNPHGANMDTYVFWSPLMNDKPMENEAFLRDLRRALLKTGMTEQSAKKIVFHGWRHYYTSYMRDRINEKLLKSQTGHKSLPMIDLYGGHKIAGDRERIQQAQIESFAKLIPETAYV
jgi:integrase